MYTKNQNLEFNIPSELVKCPRNLKKYNFATIHRQSWYDDEARYDFTNNKVLFMLDGKTSRDNSYLYTIEYKDDEVKMSLFLIGRLNYHTYSEEAIKQYKLGGYKEALAIKNYVKEKIKEILEDED